MRQTAHKPPSTFRPVAIILGVIVLVTLATFLLFRGQLAPPQEQQALATIDGTDAASGTVIDPINIFDRLPGGKRVGTVRNGARVLILRREGDTVLIRTTEGVQGYIAAGFIK